MAKEHLTAVVGADYGPFSKAMREMKGQVNGFGADMMKWGKRAAVGFGLMAAPLALVANTGMKFERQMSKVQAIINPTAKEFKVLRDEAKRLGSTTEKTATDVGGAIQQLGQAGLKTNQIMKALTPVLDMATITGLDMAQSTDMITKTLSGMSLEAKEATRVADMYVHVQSNANTTAQELAEGFKNVAATANKAGWSLETTGAALGLIADKGHAGGRGGTFLNNALAKMVRPSEEAEAIMKKLKISFEQANGEMKNLPDIIAEVEKANFKGMEGQKQMIELFGLRGVKAIQDLVGAKKTLNGVTYKGSEALSALAKSTVEASGASQKAAEVIRSDTKGAFESLSSAIEGTSIELYDKFAKPLGGFVKTHLVEVVRGLGAWIAANKQLAPTFKSIFTDAGTIVTEFVLMGKAVSEAFGMSIGKAGELNTGFLDIVKTFRVWVEELAPKLPGFIEEISTGAKNIKFYLQEGADVLKTWYGYATDFAEGVDPIVSVVQVIGRGLGFMSDGIKAAVGYMGTLAGEATAFVENFDFQAAYDDFISFFNAENFKLALNGVSTAVINWMTGGSLDWATGGEAASRSWLRGFTGWVEKNGPPSISSGLLALGKRMIGESPPELGPLSKIDVGGKNIGKAWIDALAAQIKAGATDIASASLGIRNTLLMGSAMDDGASEGEASGMMGEGSAMGAKGFQAGMTWAQGLTEGIAEGKVGVLGQAGGIWSALLGNGAEGSGAEGSGEEGGEEGTPLAEKLAATTESLATTFDTWGELSKGFTSTFTQGVGQQVGSLLTGTKTMDNAFGKMAKNMAVNWVKSLVMQNAQTLASGIFGVGVAKGTAKAKNAANASVAGSGVAANLAPTLGPGAVGAGKIAAAAVLAASSAVEAAASFTPMAEGGMVTHRTKALIGEAGPELVIPLEKMGMMGMGGGVRITMNIQTGVITRDVATDIAEALTDVVENLGVDLKASRAELAINVEDPIVA